jgi:Tol biopolymer transport system component
VWIGRDGSRQPLPLAVQFRGSMEVSPDGRYLAVIEGRGEASDLWVHDLRDFRSERITTNGAAQSPLFWSSDSRRVVYRDESPEQPGTWV